MCLKKLLVVSCLDSITVISCLFEEFSPKPPAHAELLPNLWKGHSAHSDLSDLSAGCPTIPS